MRGCHGSIKLGKPCGKHCLVRCDVCAELLDPFRSSLQMTDGLVKRESFVRDFLPVRALAVLFLLVAKVMVDAGRPHLAESGLVLVNQYFAYVLIMAGMWLTVSPYRLRDWQDWILSSAIRLKIIAAAWVGFGGFLVWLGLTVFKKLN